MDGLLKKTKYGPEYVVGKDGFMMSWVSRWTDWLNFDNYRGPNGGSKLHDSAGIWVAFFSRRHRYRC